ncbi:MAG: hypothetical protein HY817_00285 [Candidatus Abawacabacteria bacterium]|nr:hypothetical protein [Candidatus Abawacabacteria bacterium]
MYIFCLGNHRDLAVWELRSVLPNVQFQDHPLGLMLSDQDARDIDFATLQKRLGGTKEIIWLDNRPFYNWAEVLEQKKEWILHESGREITIIADGYSASERQQMLEELKELFERPVRYRIEKRYLLQERGTVFYRWENEKKELFFGQLVAQQDIAAYGDRDYGKPKRSMIRGMLPPKLAQIMLNGAQVATNELIWDPFCGTGTILIEAALLGITNIGSDKDLEAITATEENIKKLLSVEQQALILKVWQQDITLPWEQFDAAVNIIVAEGYLGQPQHKKANSPQELRTFWQKVEPIYQKFFLRLLDSSVTKMVIATPIVYTLAGESRLAKRTWQILEHKGWHKTFQSTYVRAEQIVGREITCLVRN